MVSVPELFITLPDGRQRTCALADRPLTLGRGAASELCFPEDGGLSRQHLVFEPVRGGWTVRDLGSKNGTQINGERLTGPHTLQPGDRLTASRLSIVFGRPASGAPPSPHTVVFDAAGLEQAPVATSLHEVLSLGKRREPTVPVSGPQWASPVEALTRAGRELALRRPLEDLFEVLLQLSLEAVSAERGVLMTLESGNLVARASRGGEFRISSAVRDRVLSEKASLLVRNAKEDSLFQQRHSIVVEGIQSFMAVPLQTDERVIGLIYVDAHHFFRTFTPEDLSLLTVMANIAAIRIERERLALIEETERLHAAELRQAAEIQSRHLPASAPEIPNLDLAGHHVPSRTVGGDYYDFLRFSDGRVVPLVADVAGKGMPASLLMMSLQARVQVLAETAADVGNFVTRLNRSLATTCPDNKFVTFFACAIDPASGVMAYVNAGHNPPLLVRASGEIQTLSAGGPVLGLLPKISYQEAGERLCAGDTLVLYSDGITEAENAANEEFGEERLAELVRRVRSQPAQTVLHAITQAVSDWVGAAGAGDDCTVVVVTRTGG